MMQRRMQILKDVTENERITVNELARRHGVSQVTIRTDLKVLQDEGLIRRVHGAALPPSDERISSRLNVHYEIKLRIAEQAAQEVSQGETVLIESGSTNALLARRLCETKDVTIVTNSCFICEFVREMPRAKTVLLGGEFQAASEVCVGPLTRAALQMFYVEKLFIGTDGFIESEGFTCMDLQRSEVVQSMVERARRTIVLTDSSKFFQRGVARQVALADVDMVVTDAGIPAEAGDALARNGVELRVV